MRVSSLKGTVLFGPLAYVAWNADQCLYVGMSRNGCSRPFSNPKLRAVRSKITKMQFYPCSSSFEALQKEARLTQELRPEICAPLQMDSFCCLCWSPLVICRTYGSRRVLCKSCKGIFKDTADLKKGVYRR